MADFWGPSVDAELAYRHERLFTALRAIPSDDEHAGHHEHDALALSREVGSVAVTARPDGSLRPVRAAHPLVSAARGWLLRGSGAWHVAR